jgi:hypothetical protein
LYVWLLQTFEVSRVALLQRQRRRSRATNDERDRDDADWLDEAEEAASTGTPQPNITAPRAPAASTQAAARAALRAQRIKAAAILHGSGACFARREKSRSRASEGEDVGVRGAFADTAVRPRGRLRESTRGDVGTVTGDASNNQTGTTQRRGGGGVVQLSSETTREKARRATAVAHPVARGAEGELGEQRGAADAVAA